MEQIWEIFNDVSLYVEIIFFLLTSILAFRAGKLTKIMKQRRIKRILGFVDSDICEVMIPIWNGNIAYDDNEKTKFVKEFGAKIENYEYIHKNEAESLLFIQNVFNAANINTELKLRAPTASNLSDKNNKFICGGPLSNVYLKQIFANNDVSPISLKRKILFGVKPHWYDRKDNKEFRCIEKLVPEDSVGRIIFIQKNHSDEYEEIYTSDGYVILIRYKRKNLGTFFICFGNSALTSAKAVKCIVEDVDEIYNLTKKHKNNFFLFLKCTKNGDICFDKDSVVDLTDKLFS